MKETMRWTLSVWILVIAFDLSIILSMWVALDLRITLIAFCAVALATGWIYKTSALTIEITEKTLRADRAEIEFSCIKSVAALTKEEMRNARGRDADVRAFLALRFWVHTGIKVALNDPHDPTPYWLISSRKNKEFAQLLGKKIT